jgi:hypothetical protein
MQPKAASKYIEEHHGFPFSERSLQKGRADGDGPKYRRFANTIIYTREAIDEWVAARFGDEVSSTSEESARRLLTAAKAECGAAAQEAPRPSASADLQKAAK